MNTQIFAFTEHADFHALLEVECHEMTGIRPIVHTKMDEFKGMLDLFPTIDVLLIDEPENLEGVKALEEFVLKSQDRFHRVFVLGDKIKSQKKITTFPRMQIGVLFEELKRFVNPANETHSGWTAIPVSTLIHFESLPFDLFIRVNRDKFIKRIPCFEAFDEVMLQDFESRGIKDFYCEKKHNRDFSMMLINNMINKVERSYESEKAKLKAKNDVFLTTKEIVNNLGISSRVIEVCESAIERIKADVANESGQFGAYIQNLIGNPKLTFQYKLIELTSFVSGQILEDLNLPNKDEDIKKLVFVSFFCDMSIQDQKLLHVRNSDQLEKLTLQEHNEVSVHALRASELVGTYKNAPKDVNLIIRQHHGSFSGIGFPEQKSQELHELSKIFQLSQEFAYEILANPDIPMTDLLKKFINAYYGLTSLKLLQALGDSMGRKLKKSA